MSKKRNEESRHYAKLWENVIKQVLRVVEEECDPEFVKSCSLKIKSQDKLKAELENKYRLLRRELKESCYGNASDSGSLDGRKLAAIFCKSLIIEKAFQFDTTRALELLMRRKAELSPKAFNLWVVHNVYINYKAAYYVSLQLVYLTLLERLLASEETKSKGLKLNRIGHLYKYPSPSNVDGFDVNVIIGIARADLNKKDFDMFLFAMQLYQLEMYTIEKLNSEFCE